LAIAALRAAELMKAHAFGINYFFSSAIDAGAVATLAHYLIA
jgi:hypothetical protein